MTNLKRYAVWGFLCGTFVVIIILFPSFKQTTTISLVVAVLLLFIGTSINSNPSILRQAYQWIDGREGGGKLGIALLAPLRPLADTAFLIRRSGTSKSELPILRIFMTEWEYLELTLSRTSTYDWLGHVSGDGGSRNITSEQAGDWAGSKANCPNHYGKKGWELIKIGSSDTSRWFLFKRPRT